MESETLRVLVPDASGSESREELIIPGYIDNYKTDLSFHAEVAPDNIILRVQNLEDMDFQITFEGKHCRQLWTIDNQQTFRGLRISSKRKYGTIRVRLDFIMLTHEYQGKPKWAPRQ